MLDFIREESIWNLLKKEQRPIVLYGMGDGAQKILNQCARFQIPVAGIFASDEFVRGQSFAGYPVRTLAQTEEIWDDFVILLCFAAFLPELMEKIISLSRRHTLYAPDVPVFGGELFTEDYLAAHEDEIRQAHALLADEQSRRVLEATVNFKLSGKISWLTGCETPREEVYTRLLPLCEGERYLDLGAYDGDTVAEFLRFCPNPGQMVALEPDPKNFRKLSQYADTLSAPLVSLQAGIWQQDGTLSFDGRAGRNSALSPSGRLQVPVRSVDSLAAEYGSFTLIKMDVEGVEREALLGARETLAAGARLAVSAYHRTGDFFTLPLLLHDLAPDYQIRLRHHPYIPAWETNLYATSGR